MTKPFELRALILMLRAVYFISTHRKNPPSASS